MTSLTRFIGVGQCVGPYRIEGVLGTGGMGCVYLALDTRLQRTVAIKFPSGSPQTHDALWREARLAAALSHPSICAVHEIGEFEQVPYLVMEHIRGGALSVLLELHGAMDGLGAVRLALQIADALAHAHDRGVVHGDIKSSNVMIDADGRAKLLDFGVGVRGGSAADPSGDATTSPAPENSGAGTVPYMAPELLRGHAPDVQSDVWALGVLFYEMLTGTRPFRGVTPYDTAAQILGHQRILPPPDIPGGLAPLIDRCLCAQPNERYRSVQAFSRELRGLHRALQVWKSAAPGRLSRA